MTDGNDKSRFVAALDCLRARNHFFEFDNQERVVHVAIYNTSDADEIARHIGNLRDVENLTFSETDLSDRGLAHLGGLVRLKKLWLGGAGFTAGGLAHLGSMSRLEDLYIENARGLDLAAFACIARVRSLRKLSLGGGSYCDSDMTPLAALAKLEELSLSENDIVDGTFCKHLTELPRLKYLNPGEQVTDEGLASIGRLPSLVKLFVAGPFTDAGLRYLASLKKLETLCIESPYATSQGVAVVAELPDLNYLSLEIPRLDDHCVEPLVHCSALETMHIRKSSISDLGLQHLRERMPRCSVADWERDPSEPEPLYCSDADRLVLDSDTPCETLLAKARDYDLAKGAFDKILARYEYWVNAFHYSPVERVIMLVWESGRMIDAGGFEYLFTNEFEGDPDFRLTAEAYRTLGIERSHEAFQAAFRLFPNGIVPHDPQERTRLYQAANRSARDGVDRMLRHDARVRTKRLAEFIRANAVALGDLDARS